MIGLDPPLDPDNTENTPGSGRRGSSKPMIEQIEGQTTHDNVNLARYHLSAYSLRYSIRAAIRVSRCHFYIKSTSSSFPFSNLHCADETLRNGRPLLTA